MADHPIDILVRAKDMASRTLGNIEKRVGSLGRIGSKAVSNLTANFVKLGVVAAGALTGAVAMGVRSLADLARTEAQTAAVIASTGGKAGVSQAQVRKYAEELESLSTVDDKVIQDGQNMLLTFTGISGKAFPQATKAALNMAVAMAGGNVEQVDMKASAIQLGKALNDPIKGITALRKVGVAFTEQQIKQIKALVKAGDVYGAQQVILKELEVEFGNAAQAAGTGPEAAWRRLEDAGEDLSQALAKRVLPVLERAAKWLTTKLADPAVIAFMDDLGAGIADAADQALRFIEGVDWGSIGAGLKGAADIAGSIVGMFMGLPDWVKTAVITGWGLNKLTGGAVTDLVGVLGSGLIKGVLGMNAGVVHIKAGVVTGAGGVPGAGGAGGAGLLGKAASLIPAGLVATAIIAAAVPIGEAFASALPAEWKGPGGKGESESQRRIREGREEMTRRNPPDPFRGQVRGIGRYEGGPRGARGTGEAAVLERATAKGLKPTADQITRTYNATAARQAAVAQQQIAAAQRVAFATEHGADRIVRAINNISIPQPRVFISASDSSAAQNRRTRTVKPHGPRHAQGTGPLP